MSIRLRLALQFGSILALTLLLFAAVIYLATLQSRRELFTQSLFKRTWVVGHAYADGQNNRGDAGRQASYRRYLRQLYRTLPDEEGRVYDAAGQLVFREGQRTGRPVPAAWLAEVRRVGRAVLEPETNYHETVGLLYHDARLGPLVVVASSVDEDSRQQLRQLRQLLAVGLLALTKVFVIDSLSQSITFTSWIGWPEVISVIPLVMLAGITLSVVASFISLRRYLRV